MRLVLLSALVLAIAGAQAAHAQEAACRQAISASSRAANPGNLDPPRSYDHAALARSRTIEAWRAAVAAQCPGYSTVWQLASKRTLTCDNYAGGIGCVASAAPARPR